MRKHRTNPSCGCSLHPQCSILRSDVFQLLSESELNPDAEAVGRFILCEHTLWPYTSDNGKSSNLWQSPPVINSSWAWMLTTWHFFECLQGTWPEAIESCLLLWFNLLSAVWCHQQSSHWAELFTWQPHGICIGRSYHTCICCLTSSYMFFLVMYADYCLVRNMPRNKMSCCVLTSWLRHNWLCVI